MARRIELYVDKNDGDWPAFTTNFDDYGVILYYAFTIDPHKAFLLYKAMVNKYQYSLAYDLPLDELIDNEDVYLPISQIPDVIAFINTDILPYSENLSQNLNLIEEWDVGGDLEAFLMNRGSFFDNFSIDNIDTDSFTVSYFVAVFQQLKDFFGEIHNANTIYKVSIA